MADSFSDTANSQRRQIDLLQQQLREQQMQQLQQQQMMRAQASMMRMQQMQQQMAAQITSSQAQAAIGGGVSAFGSSAAAAQIGAQGMSASSLFGQAVFAPEVNRFTGGALYPNVGYNPAFTYDRMQQDLAGELSRRFTYAQRSLVSSLVPMAIARRRGMAFYDGEFTRSGERTIQASLEFLRGGAGGDASRADGMGVRIDSDLVTGLAEFSRQDLEAMNYANRYGITTSEARRISETALGVAGSDAQFTGNTSFQALAMSISGLQSGMSSLARALQMNVDQTAELVQTNRDQGISATTTMAMRGVAARTGNPLALNNADRARYISNVMYQARGAGFSSSFGEAALGLAGGLFEDVQQGRYSREAVARFGGATLGEQAIRVADYQNNQRLNFARQNAGTYGVLSAAGVTADSPIERMMALGQIYAANPFAGLEAEQSRSVMTDVATTSFVTAFKSAKTAADQLGINSKAYRVSLFANNINESSPVVAREEYERLERRLQALGGDLGLLELQERADAAGLVDIDVRALQQALGDKTPNEVNMLLASVEGTDALRSILRSAFTKGNEGQYQTVTDILGSVSIGGFSAPKVRKEEGVSGFMQLLTKASDIFTGSNISSSVNDLYGMLDTAHRLELRGHTIKMTDRALNMLPEARITVDALRKTLGDAPSRAQLDAIAELSNTPGGSSSITGALLADIFSGADTSEESKRRVIDAYDTPTERANAVMYMLLRLGNSPVANLENKPKADGSAEAPFYVVTV